jgi:hypothetical protein
VNEKGPSTEVLFFIEYFLNFNKSPQEHVQHLLQTNGYKIKSIQILHSRVHIDDYGESIQMLELKVMIHINSMQRDEVLYISKSYKQIKKFIKHTSQELGMLTDNFSLR